MSTGPLLKAGAFRPEPGKTEATVFHCALCGTRFSHAGEVCGCCPFHARCDLVRCPHCGYEFPRGSRLVERLAALFERLRRPR